MSDPHENAESRSNPAPWLRRAGLALAGIAVLIGIILMLLPAEQRTVGWFAYQPLSHTTFVPDAGIVLSPRSILGIVLAALGALVLAFYAGWLLALRRLSS